MYINNRSNTSAMNTKHILFAAIVFIALTFTSCKEKGDDFDYTFENCVESVDTIIIHDGDIIQKGWVDLLNFEPTIKIKSDIDTEVILI